MTFIEKLQNLIPVIYPEFYTVTDNKGNELVIMKDGEMIDKLDNDINDKTAFEALVNHFHIFDKLSKDKVDDAVSVSRKIAENLLNTLKLQYPDKEFVVFLTVDPKDSTIVRFHQRWEGEYPYYTDLNSFKGVSIFEFSN